MATVDEMIRVSYDGSEMDLTSVIGEFPFGDDNPGKQIPIKKLSDEFDGCVKSDEYMKVFLRVRPIKTSLESTIVVDTDTSITTTAPDVSRRAQYTKTETRNYIFSKVYGPQAAQEEVYEATAMPLSKRLLKGENSCLFAYGMTASGKTHTIQGTASKNPGILPRLITEILSSLQADTKIESSLSISMLEIYQERIYDLLSTSKEKLTIRDGNGKVEVNKLSVHPIASSEDAVKLMDIASGKRSKSTTCLNTVSSRSHAVYTVTLERTNKKTRETSSCAFYLVDLAGAERANRTKATAQQQVEANSINVSLMKLWRCLQGIRKAKGAEKLDSSGPQDIVPFRESKLTHLLMPMLGRVGAGVSTEYVITLA
jgi:kinesin family protein 22